ncbi:MAG: IPT/TIG domain-containing protein [Treponema sp.]|nr:IPT/TIG domain-containing protein [Treponema sp.]
MSCHFKAPVIYSIHPQIGNLGEPLTIKGANFGRERDISYVTIAGVQPTGASYIDWHDDEITIRIPEFSEAGLVYVHVKGRKSNGLLYASQAALPVQTIETVNGQGPRIASITPQTGTIGALVSITGSGFGNTRGNGGVFFSWNAKKPVSAPAETLFQEYIEASASDFGVELWTEREIRVRIPDGAVSGNMEIRTAKGVSPPLLIDLSNRPGSKTYHDKRNFIVAVSVNVKTGAAEIPNTLYLWVPRPAVSASQRNIETLSGSMEPFIENYRGTSLFKLENLRASGETQLSLLWKIDVYSVETSVYPQSIRQDPNSPARGIYTRSAPQLPSDDPRVKNQTAAILGREQNPYTKAQRIYEWMVKEFTFRHEPAGGDIFTALEKKQADFYTAAMLYSTLLRSAGIPCLPVAGVLVSRNRQTINHWWAEFWIDGFGWIPVDPVMGAGAAPSQFGDNPDKASYYFGNIDSQRIAFSRGFSDLAQMDPRGRTVTHSRSYSLQNLWEEAVGGIESYSSLWGDVTITGMYAQ